MHVLVTGASGFLGGALCARLRARGDAITTLSRDPAAAQRRMPDLKAALRWDPMAGPAPAEAMSAVDAVIHLAGETVSGRWTQAKMQAIRESRVRGTRQLVESIRTSARRPRVLVCASAVGYYGDRGEEELLEASAPGSDFLALVCQQWEAEAQQAEALGVRVVRLRTGVVLAAGGGALGAMLTPFKLGAGGPLGSGRQWWSWVHRNDVVGIALAALDDEAYQGAVNVTSPEPVRQGQFARELGRALGRPALLPAPEFALKLLLGGFSVELLGSKRVLPARATALGYRFAYPRLAEALQAALA